MIKLHNFKEITDEGLFHTCEIQNYNGFYGKVSDLLPNVLHVTTTPVTASTLSFEPGFISAFDLLNFCFDI